MKSIYGEVQNLGADVLGVCYAEPSTLLRNIARRNWPFPFVTDPTRELYKALGLGKASWLRLLGPMTSIKYVWAILTGMLPRIPESEADVRQVGGDFLITPNREIVWGFRSEGPAHRPSTHRILEEIRKAIGFATVI